jgi:hypothetical protein
MYEKLLIAVLALSTGTLMGIFIGIVITVMVE